MYADDFSARNIEEAQSAYLWTPLDATGDSVVAVRAIPPTYKCFGFRAFDLHRQGHYTHGRISIAWELNELTWAALCVDRPDERARLALAAWKACPDQVRQSVSQGQLTRFLDQFCAGLWAAWSAEHSPREVIKFSGGIAI